VLGRTRHRWAGPGAGRARDPSLPAATRHLRVDVAGADAHVQARVRQLGADSEAFEVVTAGDGRGSADVAVVTIGERAADGEVVAQLRRDHRADPGRRTVVVGRGTTWFDAAFGAGVDVWIDRSADDDTVLAAIVGPRRS
jgi:hypothetical protein